MTALLQGYASNQAALRPDATAVVLGNARLSYGELEALANRIAWQLKASGCRRGDRVCLLLPKSPLAIACILAVLKADCLVVPLDVASPAARTALILRQARPRVVLVASSVAGLVDELRSDAGWPGAAIGAPGDAALRGERFQAAFGLGDLLERPAEPPPSRNAAADPAFLLFTSGSTGVPKGVVISHGNILHFIEWAKRYFDLRPSERISGHSPLHFDLSNLDIFGTFAAGAELHLVSAELNLLPHRLAAFIRTSELDQWFSVPSLLTYLVNFDAITAGDFPSLKRLLWCGEAIATPTLARLMQLLPHVSFTNLYGPTETTIASSYYTVPGSPPTSPTWRVPIGRACPGEELLVLDDDLNSVPTGEVGELYISGVGLSPGYWQDEARTRAAFLPHPRRPGERLYRTGDLGKRDEVGLFYCLGRTDSQIKSRGHRIELGEIEAALDATGLVREAAVVGVESGGFETVAIACAYAAPADLGPARLRQALARLLPSYMLPSRWECYETLPKNANGKIDRAALRRRFEAAGP